MIVSNEEQTERRKLVGYCDSCDEWYKFIDNLDDSKVRLHSCGNMPSSRPQFQITTQRSFNPLTKKLSKSAQKKIGIGNA